MTPYFEGGGVTLYHGDCLEVLRELPSESINCVVTSPPYYGLRDYGVDGQIGLEETPAAYVANLVAVFAEAWRVLRDDGVVFLNLGDSYSGSAGGRGDTNREIPRQDGSCGKPSQKHNGERLQIKAPGLKPKDLIGIPWRVAFALQDAGWYLRSDIIWAKPNPMPESVTDRPTKSHEYVFLLSNAPRYWYDTEAIRERQTQSSRERSKYGWSGRTDDLSGGARTGGSFVRMAETGEPIATIPEDGFRNSRTVWTIPTKGYLGAHFATMPPELARRCIVAGCPVGGVVLDPFGGSGTTAQIALENGRSAVLIELNADYLELQKERVKSAVLQPRLIPPEETAGYAQGKLL